ncbi:MAG: 16S rRNA (cytidine(1402)-2'-O)-methyltransferase [Nitrospirota bacterium]
MTGTLYIVSTPIGNLEDITLRALRILKNVDVIAAEDTRRSMKLLTYYNISKPMISYWREKEKVRSSEIIHILHSGQSVALISDAGTPGISDPGSLVIRAAIEQNIHIVVVPGPTAFVAALTLSGLPTEEFIFRGFLPARKEHRKKVLRELILEPRTLVFYEAPHRLLDTLSDMKQIFVERKAALIKEVTKIYEEVLRGDVSEIFESVQKSKIAGEYVIILEGKSKDKKIVTEDILHEVNSLIKKGLSRKDAVRKIADQYGVSKKELYDRSLHHDT